MIIERVFTISCDLCGTQHQLQPGDTGFRLTESERLGHSTESVYTWASQLNCSCGLPISFEYLVWEYPSGQYDTQEITVAGAKVKRSFNFRFSPRHFKTFKNLPAEQLIKI